MKMQKKIFYKERFEDKYAKHKKYCKVRDLVFQNWSNYDYYFIIKELTEELKRELSYLEENTQKYITISVPIEKEV